MHCCILICHKWKTWGKAAKWFGVYWDMVMNRCIPVPQQAANYTWDSKGWRNEWYSPEWPWPFPGAFPDLFFKEALFPRLVFRKVEDSDFLIHSVVAGSRQLHSKLRSGDFRCKETDYWFLCEAGSTPNWQQIQIFIWYVIIELFGLQF